MSRKAISTPFSSLSAPQLNGDLLNHSMEYQLDMKVLQFQNSKLIQKLEAQKVERVALENKLSQLKEKQLPYDGILVEVNATWEEVVDDLERSSVRLKDSNGKRLDVKAEPVDDGGASSVESALLTRLSETGATECSSMSNIPSQIDEDSRAITGRTKKIICNIVDATNGVWSLKDTLYDEVVKQLPENGFYGQDKAGDLLKEVENLRSVISDLHLKHRSLARELQSIRDVEAKNKAELKHLRGELESTIAELNESNCKLASLKAQKYAGNGASFPILVGNKHVSSDRAIDKQKDLQNMESALKELVDQSCLRLLELKHLYEERIELLKQLAGLQNNVKNVKSVTSSQAYILVKDQLDKAKAAVVQYQSLYEKLQVEKDNLAWREREYDVKSDVVDVFHRSAVVADCRLAELGKEIKQLNSDRRLIETKLEEASREPGRKKIIAEFKALVSSFPADMGSMQTQLSEYKEAASDVHSLRADVQSLSKVLSRKVKEWETLSVRSSSQSAEIEKLHAVVEDLRVCDSELKLFLEMYSREATESRDFLEARNSELKAWAQVQSLNSSLDEHNLEFRVKTAIEAEAISQQRLAAGEAEIADLRQKFEASKREKIKLSAVLKSKHEENEVYLSEIENIGQAYDDIQTQNQHLLQQITERDDYNIKLVLEGVRARQQLDALFMEKQTMDRAFQQANTSVDYIEIKALRIGDQAKHCSGQVQRLAEDRVQNSVNLENWQRRMLDARKSSQRMTQSLQESQSKLDISRTCLGELQIELEKERYERKRKEEELESGRRNALRLRSQIDGSPVVEKLQQELKEYREILKCSICLDRPKEVVVTKCYHLFCNPCVQKILDGRHRKCPVCAASFGANDVKPVYI